MEHTLVFTTDELKALQYWFSMAHVGKAINGFEHDQVDESAIEKIHDALYEKEKPYRVKS